MNLKDNLKYELLLWRDLKEVCEDNWGELV